MRIYQIIESSRKAYLYHCTIYKNAVAIIADGVIKGDKRIHGGAVSTTHSKAIAYSSPPFGSYVFYIDKKSLQQERKIEKYDFHQAPYDGHPDDLSRSRRLVDVEKETSVSGDIDLKHVVTIAIPENERNVHLKTKRIKEMLKDSLNNHISVIHYKEKSYNNPGKYLSDDEYYDHLLNFDEKDLNSFQRKERLKGIEIRKKKLAALKAELSESIEYLEEQARAPLYHVTSKKNAMNIVKDGLIRALTINNDTVSTTRIYDYARSTKMRLMFGPVIFYINQDTVKYHKKIKTYNIFSRYASFERSDGWAEERVGGHIPVSHVTHISYPEGERHDLDAHEMQVLLRNTPFENIEVIRHREMKDKD